MNTSPRRCARASHPGPSGCRPGCFTTRPARGSSRRSPNCPSTTSRAPSAESFAAANAAQAIIAQAADGARLRITELGAGSAEKTRLLLKAAVERQRTVLYEPVDVSASALDGAWERIEREIPGVTVTPRVMDYTHGDGHRFHLDPAGRGERQLVLYIGSSIGNFEPSEAAELLQRVRAGLKTGDSFLLGVDLVKKDSILLAAYDDRLASPRPSTATCSRASTANWTRTSTRRPSRTCRCGTSPHRASRCTL